MAKLRKLWKVQVGNADGIQKTGRPESLGMRAGPSAAFWSTYGCLSDWGVSLAEVRRDVATVVVGALLELRREHGAGHMLVLAQCDPEDRQHLVNRIRCALPESYTSVTRPAVDAALVVAANHLAEG